MNQRLENTIATAAKAIEFSAHAVNRRGILPVPDQLSKDAVECIIRAVVEHQLDHLRQIGYSRVADLFDPWLKRPKGYIHEVSTCPDQPLKAKSEPSSTPYQPSIPNSQPTRPAES